MAFRLIRVRFRNCPYPASAALTDVKLLTSTPTWLLFRSWNSALKSVSNSTAKTPAALRLPVVAPVPLKRPRNWPGSAAANTSADAETKKARPWLLKSAYCPKMANTNVVEKDLAARSGSGDGWKAWPFIWMEPLVSMRRPLAVTVATPSRVRLAPEKPSYANCSPSPPVAAAHRSAAARRRRSRVTNHMNAGDTTFPNCHRHRHEPMTIL
uniref:Uncharacterized protein n=1 Tax=Oryza punctata TaxID=4537 RepID=A0A0E0LMJ7_ORYPU